MEVEMPINT